jgi:hypothetical protein
MLSLTAANQASTHFWTASGFSRIARVETIIASRIAR